MSLGRWGSPGRRERPTGGAGSCVNLDSKKLISKVTAMAGVFNHSVCKNDELKEIQLEVLELDQALDLVRRNDTKYEGHYCLVHKESMLLVDVSLCGCMNGTRSLGYWLQLELSFIISTHTRVSIILKHRFLFLATCCWRHSLHRGPHL